MALKRRWYPSPCYSSRGGSSVRLIVIHTAEGARTIGDLGHFFQNPANQVSSHTGADDERGVIGEYVTRGNKAWTAASYNPCAVQLELCGFASWSRDTWLNQHGNMVRNAADWFAEEAKKFGLPITELTAGQAQGSGRGGCQHIDLGSGGGGHVDCGNGFPMDKLIEWARGGTSAPKPDHHFRYYDGDHAMQLAFSAPIEGQAARAAIPIGNEHADGKSRLVFGCAGPAAIRVDLMGFGDTAKLTLGGDNGRQGVGIPKNCKIVTVRLDSGGEPIGVDFSRDPDDM